MANETSTGPSPCRLAVLDVVGLTERLIGPHTPFLGSFRDHGCLARIDPAFPGVTCTAQSTYLTGNPASSHGIVANGWYDREVSEVQFWKQSNHLVHGEKLWETLRRRYAGFSCAKLFWWYNMYSSADYSITPRPMYPADGRKIFDIYSWPYSIRTEIKRDLGEFPFAGFWGPAAGRRSPQGAEDCASRWIADSAKWIETRHAPTLSLVYLPHLDYNLQRYGVGAHGGGREGPTSSSSTTEISREIAPDLQRIDAIVGDLVNFFEKRGVRVVILSEYGITDAETPVHLNRLLREKGWLVVKDELGHELLDAGASRAFAVADHQVAHVYVNDRDILGAVKDALSNLPGVSQVLDHDEKRRRGIDHPRAGDLIAVADERAWFTYYYWLDDRRAPDFSRCVDIHRKPGFDPVELFTDPKLSPLALQAKVAWRLLQKKLGFRMLMDVIPLDATLVRGSHGARPEDGRDWPVIMTRPRASLAPIIKAAQVRDVLLSLAEERLPG